jgi:hypothetical protein
MSEDELMSQWLPSLIVSTPEEGFELAIKLSRLAIEKTQPSEKIRLRLRAVYEDDPDALVAVSQVVAINFQTVAAANNYWRRRRRRLRRKS